MIINVNLRTNVLPVLSTFIFIRQLSIDQTFLFSLLLDSRG